MAWVAFMCQSFCSPWKCFIFKASPTQLYCDTVKRAFQRKWDFKEPRRKYDIPSVLFPPPMGSPPRCVCAAGLTPSSSGPAQQCCFHTADCRGGLEGGGREGSSTGAPMGLCFRSPAAIVSDVGLKCLKILRNT